jgi:hypothetical protein
VLALASMSLPLLSCQTQRIETTLTDESVTLTRLVCSSMCKIKYSSANDSAETVKAIRRLNAAYKSFKCSVERVCNDL